MWEQDVYDRQTVYLTSPTKQQRVNHFSEGRHTCERPKVKHNPSSVKPLFQNNKSTFTSVLLKKLEFMTIVIILSS